MVNKPAQTVYTPLAPTVAQMGARTKGSEMTETEQRRWNNGRMRTEAQIQNILRIKREYARRQKMIREGKMTKADYEKQKEQKRLEQKHEREMRKPGYMRKPWEIVGWTQDKYRRWLKRLVKQYEIKG